MLAREQRSQLLLGALGEAELEHAPTFGLVEEALAHQLQEVLPGGLVGETRARAWRLMVNTVVGVSKA